jgi:hypothetical protein
MERSAPSPSIWTPHWLTRSSECSESLCRGLGCVTRSSWGGELAQRISRGAELSRPLLVVHEFTSSAGRLGPVLPVEEPRVLRSRHPECGHDRQSTGCSTVNAPSGGRPTVMIVSGLERRREVGVVTNGQQGSSKRNAVMQGVSRTHQAAAHSSPESGACAARCSRTAPRDTGRPCHGCRPRSRYRPPAG